MCNARELLSLRHFSSFLIAWLSFVLSIHGFLSADANFEDFRLFKRWSDGVLNAYDDVYCYGNSHALTSFETHG